ncbi:hypothetical protein DID78_00575 [Candidatus Marinamargulisbacteria bacterium SCGC AG-343-D04]|nr:hypothetical protein DID78_00575 [Candidatus Marinamargulisbacteria bacterium SCGC AG-343-D04]
MFYRSYNNGGNYFWLGLTFFFLFGGLKTVFLLLQLFTFLPLILVAFIGFRLIKSISKNTHYNKNVGHFSKNKKHFVELVVHLLVKAIKADGVVDQREIQSILNFFQSRLRYSSTDIQWVNDLIQHALRKNYKTETITTEINQQFGIDGKKLALELIFEVVTADHHISKEEMIFIDKVTAQLNIDPSYTELLKQSYAISKTQKKESRDYEILGVSSESSAEDIKKAYRALCKKFHPDRVQHLGEEFKIFADEKIKEINRAYENITQKSPA